MITVAGFNTSMDRWFTVQELHPGKIARVEKVGAAPGGKGLHVALTCAALSERVRLVGIIDTVHKDHVEQFLQTAGVTFHGINVSGCIRNCFAIHEPNGRTTELREPGPELTDAECRTLGETVLSGVEGEGAVAVFSGSVPLGYTSAAYRHLIEAAQAAGALVIVDASGELLREAMKVKPALVKVNKEEAREFTGHEIGDLAQAIGAARAFVEGGAGAALVTLGAGGAVLVASEGEWTSMVPDTNLRSAVGAGDCCLGGVAVGLARKLPWEDVLRLGGACGAAKTQRVESGMLHWADVKTFQSKVQVTGWQE